MLMITRYAMKRHLLIHGIRVQRIDNLCPDVASWKLTGERDAVRLYL